MVPAEAFCKKVGETKSEYFVSPFFFRDKRLNNNNNC